MTVDLSQLPPPTVVEVKSVEDLTAEWLSDLHAEDPSLGFDVATEGDPLYSLAKTFATQERALREHVNASYQRQLLSHAQGTSLDGLGALPDLVRLSSEDDDDYRAALNRAPAAFGTGSRERYERAVLLADARIASVYAETPNPTELDVEWLPVDGTDPGEHTDIETNILLALEDTDDAGYQYRMLTDSVTTTVVGSLTAQDVTAYLHVDRITDPADAIAAAEAALEAYAPKIKKVRAVIPRSVLYRLLDVEGVLKVDLTTPATDVGPTAATAYEWGTFSITAGLASWL